MKFNVPHLPSHETHKRLQSPWITMYSRNHFIELGEVFSVETPEGTLSFLYGNLEDFEKWSSESQLDAGVMDLIKHFTTTGGISQWNSILLVGIDGIWGRSMNGRAWLSGLDIHNSWGWCPEEKKLKRVTSLMYGTRDDPGAPQIPESAWARLNALGFSCKEIMCDLDKNWIRSRQKWKRAEKKSGRLAAAQEKRAIDAAAELAEAKRATKEHILQHIELLQSQLEDIENDVVSVARCSNIFASQNHMTHLNARLKKACKL